MSVAAGRLSNRISTGWAYVFTGAMVLFSLFPVYWVLATSLKTKRDGLANPPLWLFDPTSVSFPEALDPRHLQVHLPELGCGDIHRCRSVAGNRHPNGLCHRSHEGSRSQPGRRLADSCVHASRVPFVLPMFSLYQWTGLYDTHMGLALMYQVHVLPLSIWLLSSFFREINPAIDEAARMEGATHLQILTKIYIPCTLPGMAATAVLNAIWIWNELAIALGLTFSKAQTVTLGVTSFRGYAALDWGAMTAASIIAIIPMLLFALVAQKQIVKGLTLGAVKGQ